jgi:phosphatidylglycerol:prolipoprotein diacylglycerol transferase
VTNAAYVGFIGAGIAVGAAVFVIGWRGAGRRCDARMAVLMLAVTVSGLIAARLYAVVEQGWRWDLIATIEGGFRLPGGVIGLLVGLVIWRRLLVGDISVGVIGDLGTIATQFGLAVVRLGCLAEGCCFGTRCDLPWAVRFPRGTQAATVHVARGLIEPGAAASLPVHPLQLYFMALHFAVGLVLVWWARRKTYDGQVLLLGLVLSQGGKALLEAFRQPIPGVPTAHLQVASAALAIAAAMAMAIHPIWSAAASHRTSDLAL